jgi:hypothetical protein
MRAPIQVIGLMVLLALSPARSSAEVPPLPEEELKSKADLIILGTVNAMRQSEAREGETVRTNYLIDVTIWSAEKGRPSAPNRPVGARGWRLKSAPDRSAGPSGHYYLSSGGDRIKLSDLRPGSKVRMYLGPQLTDGTRELISPNGFQILPDAAGQ